MFKPLVSVQIGEIAGHIYEHLPLQIGGETPGRQRASEIFSVSLDDISTHPAILPLFGLWPQSMQYESVFGTVVERSALLFAGVGGAEGVVPADGEQTLQRGFESPLFYTSRLSEGFSVSIFCLCRPRISYISLRSFWDIVVSALFEPHLRAVSRSGESSKASHSITATASVTRK